MIVVKADHLNSLTLGRRGENLTRQIIFNVSDWEAEYGHGTVELIAQRPGDEKPYPVAVKRDGTQVIWEITSVETAAATQEQTGKCELRYYVGEVLAKSKTWRLWVDPAMDTPSETAPPEPEQGWVDQVMAVGAAAKASAEAAKADADRVATIAAEVAANAAQAAQDATVCTQAKEAAQTARRLADTAQKAAEAAKRSAEAAKASVAQSATDAEAAKQGAETAMQVAQEAAESAAQALADIQALYQQVQALAQGAIQVINEAGSAAVQSVQSAGDAQVQRVTAEGTTQTAKAKAQADAAAQSAADAAQSAQEAAESAAVYDNVVADVTQLKSDIGDVSNILTNDMKNRIIESMKRPISFNKVGMTIKNAYVKDGEIIFAENSDLAVAEVSGGVVATSFLGRKSFNEWKSSDPDIVFFSNTYFFDKDMNFISKNNNTFENGVSGNHVSLLGKTFTTPENCAYVAQRYKEGYLDSAVITDVHWSLISSYNMDIVWKAANGDDGYTLKAYSLPLTNYEVNNLLVNDESHNTTYPFRVLPGKSYKVTSGDNATCVEYDNALNILRKNEFTPQNGYFSVTVGADTSFISVSYGNEGVTPFTFTAMENNSASGNSNIAYTPDDVIRMLEIGGTIELLPNTRYVFTDTLTYHQDTTTIKGNGAVLDFSAILGDKPAIRIISKRDTVDGTIIPVLRDCYPHFIEGCYIVGSNITMNYEGGRNGYGILCKGEDDTLRQATFVTIRNCTIAGFKIGVLIQNQSWCVNVDSCNINVCDTGFAVSYGYRNYGEKLSIINSVVNTCSVGVSCANEFCTIQMINSSLDASFLQLYSTARGKIYCSGCHFENTKDKNYFIVSEDEGFIVVKNSVFHCTQKNYGLCRVNGNSTLILRDNVKEHFEMPESTVDPGANYVEEWLN